MPTRIGSSSPDHDAATAARVRQTVVGESNVVVAFLQRPGGSVFGQATVTMLDPEHLGSLFKKRKGSGSDHGVGRRCGATCEQDCNAFDIQRMVFRHSTYRQLAVVGERSQMETEILGMQAKSPRPHDRPVVTQSIRFRSHPIHPFVVTRFIGF